VERFLFSKVEVWALLLVVLGGALGTVAFGWLVFHGLTGGERFPALTRTAVEIARIPQTVRDVVTGEIRLDDHEVESRFDAPPGFTFHETVEDPQFVLVARYDGNINWSVVELYKEGEAEPRHRWVFDDVEALAVDGDPANPFFVEPEQGRSYTVRMGHPWLSEDGSLTVNSSGGALYQVDACGDPIWSNSRFSYHHGLEADADGTFWAVGTRPTAIEGQGWDDTLRDDHAVQVSPDGRVLYAKSVLEILQTAELLNLIYDYDSYQTDPIHLNDVQPVPRDGRHWRAGDIFLSIAHLNMVMLFRPSTDELIWYSQDRIMHQHDIDLIGDGVISVFDNRRKTGANGTMVLGANEIVHYHLPETSAHVRHAERLAQLDVRTASQGLVDALPGSGMMIEETDGGRLLKLAEDGALEWVFLNKSEDGRAWTLNWSRYVPNGIGDRALQTLESISCTD